MDVTVGVPILKWLTASGLFFDKFLQYKRLGNPTYLLKKYQGNIV